MIKYTSTNCKVHCFQLLVPQKLLQWLKLVHSNIQPFLSSVRLLMWGEKKAFAAHSWIHPAFFKSQVPISEDQGHKPARINIQWPWLNIKKKNIWQGITESSIKIAIAYRAIWCTGTNFVPCAVPTDLKNATSPSVAVHQCSRLQTMQSNYELLHYNCHYDPWSINSRKTFTVVFQMWTHLSKEPLARCLPSGLKATL